MPKINFNTPLVDHLGKEITKVKINKDKVKVNADGVSIPEVYTDGDGVALREPMLLKDSLCDILNNFYQGDERLPFGDRVKRGKLARKVATSSSANYNPKELLIIEELAAKSGSVAMCVQIDDLINGPDKSSDSDESDTNDNGKEAA